jgi:hypothetical protein
MKPTVPLIGMASLSLCLALHILLWRHARPRSDVWALFLSSLGFPTLLALIVLGGGAFVPRAGFPALLGDGAVLLLHWALSAAYVQSYPADQARSPSLEIANVVAKSLLRGLPREELLTAVGAGSLVKARVEGLVSNRLVRMEGDRCVLTPSAERLVDFVVWLRTFLGLSGRGG